MSRSKDLNSDRLGKLLVYYRMGEGLHQKDLATEIRISQPTLSYTEHGLGATTDTMEKILIWMLEKADTQGNDLPTEGYTPPQSDLEAHPKTQLIPIQAKED